MPRNTHFEWLEGQSIEDLERLLALVIHAHGHHEYQSTQEMIEIAELEKLWTIEGCTRSKKPE